jgi:hypothetical protein
VTDRDGGEDTGGEGEDGDITTFVEGEDGDITTFVEGEDGDITTFAEGEDGDIPTFVGVIITSDTEFDGFADPADEVDPLITNLSTGVRVTRVHTEEVPVFLHSSVPEQVPQLQPLGSWPHL